MNYIFLNLKRFDIPKNLGGINTDEDVKRWGEKIIKGIDEGIKPFENVRFASFLPEAHIIRAVEAKSQDSKMDIGSQSIHWSDVIAGGNFGAFTTGRTAKAMLALGCSWTIIGHCEERRDIEYILLKGGIKHRESVSYIFNNKIKAAEQAGMYVLYCVGETEDELPNRYDVIKAQLENGLKDADLDKIVVAYEPVWAIGPGKTPPDVSYIQDIAGFIKSVVDVPVVYGGGLKQDNAATLASIREIDGGLIALTRFSGDIGFYPDEYLDIVNIYLKNKRGQ